MIDYLYRIVWGWVEVIMTGAGVEAVMSRIVMAGHRLWRVHRIAGGMRFVASMKSLPAIRRASRGQGIRVRFGHRGGAPFYGKTAHRRPFLLLGLLSAAVMVGTITARVWVIAPPPGLSPRAQAVLVDKAEASGLYPGVSKAGLALTAIRGKMLRALPEYSWIGITVHGVVAQIQVVPFVGRPRPHVLPRLVALYSGRVTDVWVYMGEARVNAGDRVRRGQTLIEGAVTEVMPDASAEASHLTQTVKTPAEGVVWANVDYRCRLFQPYRITRFSPTGRVYTALYLSLPDRSLVPIRGFHKVPYRHYKVSRTVNPIRWSGVTLPVELIKMVYNQEIGRSEAYSRTEAIRRATTAAEQRLSAEVPRDGRVIGRKRRVQATKTGVWVDVTWTVNQDIAGSVHELKRTKGR